MENKTLNDFEQKHGQPKIKALNEALEVERRKVEELASIQNKVILRNSPDCHIQFAMLGDIHVGSLYFNEAAFISYCEYLAGKGITDVYIAGDIIDGHKIYRGQEFELRDLGFDAQLDRLASIKLPEELQFYFITGNHDTSFKNEAGINAGKAIERVKPNWKFIGEMQGHIVHNTPNGDYKIDMLHPGGGCSYALSYRLQKIIESLEGGTKPHLIGVGHYHKSLFLPSYRNVCGILAGTFQKQTPFMARGGLAAHVGGWEIDVCVEEGANTVSGRFTNYY